MNSDIAFEILTRADIKDLDMYKTVCKEWNKIPFESTFNQIHSKRTGTISGYFYQNPINLESQFVSANESNHNISLKFLPRPLWKSNIVASTKQGILCCESKERNREHFFICKPSTQQWVKLPNPKMRHDTKHVGIAVVGSDPLWYKIVRVSMPNYRDRKSKGVFSNYYCELFDSKTGKWIKLDDVWLPRNVTISSRPPVVIGCSIYWLLSNDIVLEFNTDTKHHIIFLLPHQLILRTLEDENKQLVEYKGKLGFTSSKDNFLLRWILEDFRKHKWQEIESLSLEDAREKGLGRCIGFWNGDIAVMIRCSNISFYDFNNCTFQKVEIPNNLVLSSDNFFEFRSDLEPTQLLCRG